LVRYCSPGRGKQVRVEVSTGVKRRGRRGERPGRKTQRKGAHVRRREGGARGRDGRHERGIGKRFVFRSRSDHFGGFRKTTSVESIGKKNGREGRKTRSPERNQGALYRREKRINFEGKMFTGARSEIASKGGDVIGEGFGRGRTFNGESS